MLSLGQQGRQLDLLKQVVGVVGAAAVRAQGHVYAGLAQGRYIRHAAAQLQIAHRAVDGGGAFFRQ